jgi:hypothetical protein
MTINTGSIYYYPFCSKSYWPTAFEAMEEMRKQVHYGRKITVYPTIDEAQHIAESTVFDDETWIIVEIKVSDSNATYHVAPHHGDYADEKFDDDLLQYFNVNTLCE